MSPDADQRYSSISIKILAVGHCAGGFFMCRSVTIWQMGKQQTQRSQRSSGDATTNLAATTQMTIGADAGLSILSAACAARTAW